MPLDFDKYAEQVESETSGGGGNGAFTGRIGRGTTDIRWVVPVDAENADLSQSYQEVFTPQGGGASLSDKAVIYALVASSPGADAKAFMPYGWDGDWSEVEHEETLAHAANFGKGRRVIPLSVTKSLHKALKDALTSVDDPVTEVNFATGEIVKAGAIFRLTREGSTQKDTKYFAVVLNRKADVTKVDALIGQGMTVVPPTERLSEFAEKLRTANAEKAAKAAPGAKPQTQF